MLIETNLVLQIIPVCMWIKITMGYGNKMILIKKARYLMHIL
jgi:hypothetical protein